MLDTGLNLFSDYFTPEEIGIRDDFVKKYWPVKSKN